MMLRRWSALLLLFFLHPAIEAFVVPGDRQRVRMRAVDPTTVVDYGELAATAAKRVSTRCHGRC